jgi:hypothetical protein
MRLVDTAAWIEWLTGSPLGTVLNPQFPDRAQWLAPTLVQLESAMWLTCASAHSGANRHFDERGIGYRARR